MNCYEGQCRCHLTKLRCPTGLSPPFGGRIHVACMHSSFPLHVALPALDVPLAAPLTSHTLVITNVAPLQVRVQYCYITQHILYIQYH